MVEWCFLYVHLYLIRGPLSGERTVKRLRLSKALTVSDDTSIREACCRMAARRVDALLLTDSNALLCGILTDKVFDQLLVCYNIVLIMKDFF